MATLQEIMLGLKSQEGDDKKVEFSNALLGQAPQAAVNNILASFEESLINGAQGDPSKTPFGQAGVQAGKDFRQNLIAAQGIAAQVPGIENITLGQAPIVSQEGIQYQTPDVFSSIGLGSARGVTPRDMSRPEQVIPAGRFGGQSEARITDLSPSEVQGRGRIAPSGYGTQTVSGAAVPATTDQLLGQVTPTIQSITETEQAQEQAPQPQATFTSPFEGSGLTTVGGASLSEFLSGAAMPEQGFARAERQMAGRGITLTPEQFNELSAQREARLAARPDFMRGVSDRERRGTGEMSMADATKLTGGDRDKARAMIELQRQGRDPMTGQVVKDRGELTFDQKLAQNKFDFDVAKFSFEQEKEASDAATALRKSEEAAKYAVRDTLRQNENVMRKAQRAGQNIGLTTTGATGALFGMIPGTGAYDQKATIETLQADAAFSTLQRMRDASKTGGALGNVSERELDLLMGAVGNLKIGQSEEQFRNNLAEYVNLRNEALLNIYDAFAADYSPEAANEAFKINSREDLIPSETGSSQSRGTPVETQSGRYEVTTI